MEIIKEIHTLSNSYSSTRGIEGLRVLKTLLCENYQISYTKKNETKK